MNIANTKAVTVGLKTACWASLNIYVGYRLVWGYRIVSTDSKIILYLWKWSRGTVLCPQDFGASFFFIFFFVFNYFLFLFLIIIILNLIIFYFILNYVLFLFLIIIIFNLIIFLFYFKLFIFMFNYNNF